MHDICAGVDELGRQSIPDDDWITRRGAQFVVYVLFVRDHDLLALGCAKVKIARLSAATALDTLHMYRDASPMRRLCDEFDEFFDQVISKPGIARALASRAKDSAVLAGATRAYFDRVVTTSVLADALATHLGFDPSQVAACAPVTYLTDPRLKRNMTVADDRAAHEPINEKSRRTQHVLRFVARHTLARLAYADAVSGGRIDAPLANLVVALFVRAAARSEIIRGVKELYDAFTGVLNHATSVGFAGMDAERAAELVRASLVRELCAFGERGTVVVEAFCNQFMHNRVIQLSRPVMQLVLSIVCSAASKLNKDLETVERVLTVVENVPSALDEYVEVLMERRRARRQEAFDEMYADGSDGEEGEDEPVGDEARDGTGEDGAAAAAAGAATADGKKPKKRKAAGAAAAAAPAAGGGGKRRRRNDGSAAAAPAALPTDQESGTAALREMIRKCGFDQRHLGEPVHRTRRAVAQTGLSVNDLNDSCGREDESDRQIDELHTYCVFLKSMVTIAATAEFWPTRDNLAAFGDGSAETTQRRRALYERFANLTLRFEPQLKWFESNEPPAMLISAVDAAFSLFCECIYYSFDARRFHHASDLSGEDEGDEAHVAAAAVDPSVDDGGEASRGSGC